MLPPSLFSTAHLSQEQGAHPQRHLPEWCGPLPLGRQQEPQRICWAGKHVTFSQTPSLTCINILIPVVWAIVRLDAYVMHSCKEELVWFPSLSVHATYVVIVLPHLWQETFSHSSFCHYFNGNDPSQVATRVGCPTDDKMAACLKMTDPVALTLAGSFNMHGSADGELGMWVPFLMI